MTKKGRTLRHYPIGFKQQAVGRMKAGANVSALARELGIDRTLLYIWSRKMEGRRYGKSDGVPDLRDQRIVELEGKIAALEGALGRKTQEVDFFEGALRTIEAIRQKRNATGETPSTEKSADESERKAD